MKNAHHHWLIAAGLFVIAQAIYTFTLFPTVAYGDSGALTSVAYTLGIAHPPGYPLFTLLTRLFCLIPFESVAWRVNFASAVFGSAGVIFLYLTMMHLTRSVWASLFAAGLYAFSPVVWHHSLLAEVFSLNNFFITVTAYLSLTYRRSQNDKILFLLAYMTGLGLSHHHSLIFWAGPLWLWLFFSAKHRIIFLKTLRVCILLVVMGLTPYLFLRINALREPAVVWGDLSSWLEFFRHIQRFRYGTLSLIPDSSGDMAGILTSLWFYFRHIPFEMLFIGVPIAAWGLYRGMRERAVGGFILTTLGAFALSVAVFHILARLPVEENNQWALHIQKFWMMPNLFLFIWLGFGFYRLSSSTAVARRLAPIAVLILVMLQLALHYKSADQSDNWFFYNDAKMKLAHLPLGSILLTSGDTADHTVQYVHVCEHLRSDVTTASLSMLNQYWAGPIAKRQLDKIVVPGDVFMPSSTPVNGRYIVSVHGKEVGYRDAYSLSYLFDANIAHHPIYTCKFLRYREFKGATSWSKNYVMLQAGSLNKVLRKGDSIQFNSYLDECSKYLPDLDTMGRFTPARGTWQYLMWTEYWNDYQTQFFTLVRMADQLGADDRSLKLLQSLMETFAQYCPYDLHISFYWDMALAYSLSSQLGEPGHRALQELWNSRLKSAAPPSPDYPQKILQALHR
ncbi:MAG: DUF2723 domain-containing protein [Candidatus Latescibacterota bacterium]